MDWTESFVRQKLEQQVGYGITGDELSSVIAAKLIRYIPELKYHKIDLIIDAVKRWQYERKK